MRKTYMNMNHCVFSGSLVNDCQIIKTKKGIDIIKFNLAVKETNYKTKELKTIYLNCVRFMEDSSKLAPHLKQGKHVNIISKYQTNIWVNNNGVECITPEFRIINMEFHEPSSPQQYTQEVPPQQYTQEVPPQEIKSNTTTESNASQPITNVPPPYTNDDGVPF